MIVEVSVVVDVFRSSCCDCGMSLLLLDVSGTVVVIVDVSVVVDVSGAVVVLWMSLLLSMFQQELL